MKRSIASLAALSVSLLSVLTFSTTYSLQASAQSSDRRLWEKFLRYDLCITDYDSLTDEEKELCRFIFETERYNNYRSTSSMDRVRCERARRILAGDDVGERITLEGLESCYGLQDYYSYSNESERWYYYTHCVPDIIHIDVNRYIIKEGYEAYSTYNEYWLDDEGSSYVVFNTDTILNDDKTYSKAYSFDIHNSSGEVIDFIPALVYDTPYFDFRGHDDEMEKLGYIHKNGGWYYTKDDGTAVFAWSDENGKIYDDAIEEPFVIESEIEGCPVTAIEHKAFLASRYKEIIIPESVETIDYFAFDLCVYLEKINLPHGLKYLSIDAFNGCESLKNISIDCPDAKFGSIIVRDEVERLNSAYINVKKIDESAFDLYTYLTDVSFGDDVTAIGAYAFRRCESLKNIELTANIRSIGQGAFLDSGIEAITIPPTVKIIGTLPLPIGEDGASLSFTSPTNPLTDKPVCAFEKGCVIYGYRGTEAERYAKEWNLKFIELDYTKGDVNFDGQFSISDVVALQRWLLNAPGTELTYWKAADLCDDDRLDVFDLCLMKRALLDQSEK